MRTLGQWVVPLAVQYTIETEGNKESNMSDGPRIVKITHS